MDAPSVSRYKFSEVYGWTNMDDDLPGRLTTLAYIPIAVAFSGNLKRVADLPMLIADTVFWNILIGRATGQIPLVTGDPRIDMIMSGQQNEISIFHARTALIDTEIANLSEDDRNQLIWRVGSYIFGLAADNVAKDIASGGPNVSRADGTESLYYTMVLSAYAAFETLATDLWIATHNAHPHIFRTDSVASASAKTIRLRSEAVAEPSPGEYLRDKGGISFGSQRSFLEAYRESFGCLSDVYKILDPNNSIWNVAAVRHIIAHRNGRIDVKFKDMIADSPRLSSAPLDKPLEMDGPLVRQLVDTCSKTAINLIEALDKWSRMNGTSSTTTT